MLLGLISIVPIGWTLAIADGIGWIVFQALRKRARLAVDNVVAAQIVSNHDEARIIARRCFQSFTRMIAETVLVRYVMTKDNWRDYVTIEGSDEALGLIADKSRGAVVASGHIGSWDVAARAASMLAPVSVIYRPFNNPYVNDYINSDRGGEQLHLISKYKANPMRFLKVLAEGHNLALMIDQHISEVAERVRVEFFGRECWTTRSVAMMYLTLKKPVLVACAVRTGKMKFKLIVSGPLTFDKSGDREKDVHAITQEMTRMIEDTARQYPEQYLWGHNRWRD